MSQYSADKHNADCVYIILRGCTEPSEAAHNAKYRDTTHYVPCIHLMAASTSLYHDGTLQQ